MKQCRTVFYSLVLLTVSYCFADEVVLKNGKVLTGVSHIHLDYLFRRDDRNAFTFVFAVDPKIVHIHSDYAVRGIQFTHPNYAKISEIRLPVAITMREFNQVS